MTEASEGVVRLNLVDGRGVNLFYAVDWEGLDVELYRSELVDGWEGAL